MNNEPLKANKVSSLERRNRLGDLAPKSRNFNFGYSLFIRRMRIVLPLVALCIIAILFSWNTLRNDTIIAQTPENKTDQGIGRNELLNPRFESVDDKNQPFTITAERALQGEGKNSEMFLEKPMADIVLSSGNWLAIQSDKGTYGQESQTLSLHDNVVLYHDTGYSLKMSMLDIDLEKSRAENTVPIEGYGPAGKLNAQGVQADSKAQTVIFKGPAKLVIFETGNGLNLKRITP